MKTLHKIIAVAMVLLLTLSVIPASFAMGENETEALPIGNISTTPIVTTQDANETEAIPITFETAEESVAETAAAEEVVEVADEVSEAEEPAAVEETVVEEPAAVEETVVEEPTAVEEVAEPAAEEPITVGDEATEGELTAEVVEITVVDEILAFTGTICWDDDSNSSGLRPDEVYVSVYYYDASGERKSVTENCPVPGDEDDPETEDVWEFILFMPVITYDEVVEEGGYFEAFVNPNSEDYYCSDDTAVEDELGYKIEADAENYTLDATLTLVEPEPEPEMEFMTFGLTSLYMGAATTPTLGIDKDAGTITAKVAWDDADVESSRPDSLIVTLQYDDGWLFSDWTDYATATATAADDWYVTFNVDASKLNSYDSDEWRVTTSYALAYTVTKGTSDNNFVMTCKFNPINPDSMTITPRIVWVDDGNVDSRPESIQILVYEKYLSSASWQNYNTYHGVSGDYYLTKDNNWCLTIGVSETSSATNSLHWKIEVVGDYSNYEITGGTDDEDLVLTFKLKTCSITVHNVWIDGDGTDRPSCVVFVWKIIDGKPNWVDHEVLGPNDSSCTFTDLDYKSSDGEAIAYAVSVAPMSALDE